MTCMCDLANGFRSSNHYETPAVRLRTGYYGDLLPVTAFDANLPLPFSPLEEAEFALKHQGYYPLRKVAVALLPTVDTLPNQEVIESHVDEPEEMLEEIHGW